MASQLALTALRIAKSQLGIVEEKGNKGPHVAKYLASVGLGVGYAWCMALVYWCFQQAAKELKVINPIYKTGGVLKQMHMRKPFMVSIPQPGDLFVMDHGKGLGHIGFVDTVDLVAKTFTTCEGNSDSKGSRTGGSVCDNTRKWDTCKTFLRF